jgi:hypothetical protein
VAEQLVSVARGATHDWIYVRRKGLSVHREGSFENAQQRSHRFPTALP